MNRKLKEDESCGIGYDGDVRDKKEAISKMWDLLPGWSIDFTGYDVDGMSWDFTRQDKRDRAEEIISNKRAMLIIGSPLCSARNQNNKMGKLCEEHLRFYMKLYRIQMGNGLYFIH